MSCMRPISVIMTTAIVTMTDISGRDGSVTIGEITESLELQRLRMQVRETPHNGMVTMTASSRIRVIVTMSFAHHDHVNRAAPSP